MAKITDEDYNDLIKLANELTDHLDQVATHINRFNILLGKLGNLAGKVIFRPPEIDQEFRNLLEEFGETVMLLGEDFTAIGLNGKAHAEKMNEIIKVE